MVFHTNWRDIELECIFYKLIRLLNKLHLTTHSCLKTVVMIMIYALLNAVIPW